MSDEERRAFLKKGSVDSSDVRRYYDDLANAYDATLKDWDYRAPDDAAAMLTEHVESGAAIFDAGCGTGLTGVALRSAGFTGAIDGGDLSPDSVTIAKERGLYRSVGEMNFQALPLPLADGGYDATLCVGVLTYIPDSDGLLRDFCRVTRPGGIVLVTHREDLFEQQGFEAKTRLLEDEGLWTRIALTEPRAYIPGNPDFAETIGVVYGVFRVSG